MIKIEPVLNPVDGTALITLKDGVSRKFDLDAEAMILAEEASGMSLLNPGAAIFWGSVRGMRAFLYGGLYKDAVSRKEPWSPQRIAQLMDPLDFPVLRALCAWAYRIKTLGPEALRPAGETKAAGKRSMAKRGRGPGTKS